MNTIKRLYKNHCLLFFALIAFILNIALECLGRRSLIGGFSFAIHYPLMFIYNEIIIFATLSFCLIFKRRIFFLTLFSILWITCGIVNFVLLGFRVTPFSIIDLQILSSALSIMHVYMKNWQIGLFIMLIAAAIIGLIPLWLKAPKYGGKISYIKSFSVIIITVISVFAINSEARKKEAIQSNFPNIVDAYAEYGFAYCFLTGFFDQGIKRPDNYSAEYMDAMKQNLDNSIGDINPETFPNIIMIQLESFIDVNDLIGMKFSENPVPAFTRLKNNYSSGKLTVPSIGGGTANTEFEVLTGLNLQYFGAGEYPYKTELIDKSIESICYDLKKYGYSTHALHNNDGTFYDRHKVFPNLGFDTFTSIEYMNNATFNILGWAEDKVLLEEISNLLTFTEATDFVYAITVQTHGKYPNAPVEGTPMDIKIESSEKEIPPKLKNEFEYYINQLREVDRFIEEITDYYADYSEPVIIVFFGDHLPSLKIESSDILSGNLLQTEYVIWSNYEIPLVEKDLESFRLSAHIFDILGFNGGYVNKYNMLFSEDADYPSGLQYLGYDMLNGFGRGKINPTEMKMGTRKIHITDISESPNKENKYKSDIMVKGENFTQNSVVIINNKRFSTEFLDSNTLMIYKTSSLRDGDIITVAQIGNDFEILSASEEYSYSK